MVRPVAVVWLIAVVNGQCMALLTWSTSIFDLCPAAFLLPRRLSQQIQSATILCSVETAYTSVINLISAAYTQIKLLIIVFFTYSVIAYYCNFEFSHKFGVDLNQSALHLQFTNHSLTEKSHRWDSQANRKI